MLRLVIVVGIFYVGAAAPAAIAFPGLYSPQDHTATWPHWIRRYDANLTKGSAVPGMEYWAAKNITSQGEFVAALMAAGLPHAKGNFVFVIVPPDVLRIAPANDMAKHICLAQNGSVLASGKMHVSRRSFVNHNRQYPNVGTPFSHLRPIVVRFTLESGTYMRHVPPPEQRLILRATEHFFTSVLHAVALGRDKYAADAANDVSRNERAKQ